MNRLRFSLLAAVCLIVPASVVWSAPAPAERSGLEQVPASASIVVYVRGIQGTRDRFVTMMENALPDVLKKIQPQMDDFLKEGRDGRKIRGLVKDGPIFFAILELPKPGAAAVEPTFAVILAVSNYKEFRDNLLTEEERKNLKDEGNGIESAMIEKTPKPTYFVERKGYAMITPDKASAESFTKKMIGLNTRMNKELAAKLLNADMGVFVNMDTINKDYGEQIKVAKDGIEQMLGPIAAAGDESQKKFVELFKKAIGPVFQAVEDMNAVLTTVEFRPGGLALHLQSEMKENSTTANLLNDARPVAFKELERLPGDRSYYLGMKASASMLKNLGSLLSGLPNGDTKNVTVMMDELAKAGPDTIVSGGSFPATGLSVYHFDDPAKAVAATLKMYRDMDPKTANLKDKPDIKTDAETFGDFKLNSVQMVWDFDKMAEPAAQKGEEAKKQSIAAMKGVLGEKSNVWFGTDGKVVVQINAPDWTTARKLLERYSKGTGTVGDDKAFRAARKEMPARTSLLGLIDAVQMLGTVMEALKPLVPAGQLPPGWPNLPAKGTTSFIGLALTMQPQRGSFDLFITSAAAQEFYKAVVKPLVPE